MTARDVLIKTLGNDVEYADAILSALAAAGFKVVGREPTEEMIRAGEHDRRLVTSGPDTIWQMMFNAADPRGPGKEGK